MKILKINSLLAMLLFSFFMFTACEDSTDPDDPQEGTPLPAAITNLQGAGISDTEIKVTWTASADANETWFKDYVVTVVKDGTTDTVSQTNVTTTSYTFNGAVKGTVYAISIIGRNTSDSINPNNIKTFKWATAVPFTKDDTQSEIKIYGPNSQYGSGLELYNLQNEAPAIWKVANITKWNLAFSKEGTKIGSAKASGYANASTVATDALITSLENWDGNTLSDGPYQTTSFESKTFSTQLIDLASNPTATAATKGVCFYAKVGNNYAKIVVVKNGNSFVWGSGNDVYFKLLVSYQTASGVPYAKIFAGK